MNKKNQNFEVKLYQSPSCLVFEMQPEGVLCQSGISGLGISDWEENEDVL